MAISASSLPENLLKLMRPQDRKALGVQSSEEAQEKCENRQEKELQADVTKFLSFQRAEGRCHFIIPPMHERSKLPKGWPDLTLFLPGGRTLLVEFKTPTGRLRAEQVETHISLAALKHDVYVIRSISDFLKLWRQFNDAAIA